MDSKSLKAIERILAIVNELNILIKGRDSEYFYDRLEMNVLLDLLNEIDTNIDYINEFIKKKYNYINWNVIKDGRYEDDVFGISMKIGKAWELVCNMDKEFRLALNEILNNELEDYYHKLCIKKHNDIQSTKKSA